MLARSRVAAPSELELPRLSLKIRMEHLGPTRWCGSNHESTSGLAHPTREVVRDSTRWAVAWPHTQDNAAARLPAVDFTKHMVVIVGLGSKPTTGYDIMVDSAAIRQSEQLIFVQITSNDSCPGGAMLTRPVDVVQVPRSRLPVRFIEDTVQVKC